MRAAIVCGPGDIRVEDRPEPTLVNPTDALIRLTTTCEICTSGHQSRCVHGTNGGPAPVRKYLPHLVDLIMDDLIEPGRVFDLEVSLDDIAEGYAAMDERRAIKALVRL